MFDRHFEVLLADTAWARDVHYSLRYQVYCLDRGYEDPQSFPNRRERDGYDEGAVHFVIRSTESAEWLAALRLIIVPLESLPMTRVCEIYKDRLPSCDEATFAEASRLCAVTPRQKLQFAAGLTTPWMSMALIRAARAYLLEHNIRYCFFLIADSLARVLKRVGMEFTPVGPVSTYRGKRRPYIHDVQLGYSEMPVKAPELHNMFSNQQSYRLASQSSEHNPETKRRQPLRHRHHGTVLITRGV